MNLTEINNRLQEIAALLPVLLRELNELEYTYNKRYYDVLIHSGMGNAEKREAEAYQTCDAEGVLKPFLDKKIDLRSILSEKECLIELSRNIRAMRGEL